MREWVPEPCNLQVARHFNQPKRYTWTNRNGYLPSLVTTFEKDGADVRIESFVDQVELQGKPNTVLCSRVTLHNKTNQPLTLDPSASPALVRLNVPKAILRPHQTANHDFALVLQGPLAGSKATQDLLRQSVSFAKQFRHMKAHWNGKLSEVAQVNTPDKSLNEAYRAGTIYNHIIRDGSKLRVGENGYHKTWDHDAIGILASMLTAGDLKQARELLTALPTTFDFPDAKWKYAWPWALYLLRSGDKAFVRQHFPVIRRAARGIGQDRTEHGLMKQTTAIDAKGLWTVDNWSALMGLRSYHLIARELGDKGEARWAKSEYDKLLRAANKQLRTLTRETGLDYIPASLTEPNAANRTGKNGDANWASHFLFGRWAWDGYLAGAPQHGPNVTLIDKTYDHGFCELAKLGFPKGTFGGFPGYCTAYNAGYGSAGLRGTRHRTAGIEAYQFMIKNAQSGPYSFWENAYAPDGKLPYEGIHPRGGLGSAPHMWGQSAASKVLLDSLVAEFHDGKLIVGRGIPSEWIKSEQPISVTNYPIQGNRRVGVTIQGVGPDRVRLTLDGDLPAHEVQFSLPAFCNNIHETTSGRVDQQDGTVHFSPRVRSVDVQLKRPL